MTKSRQTVLARLITEADKDQPNVRAVLNSIKVEQTREANIRAICGRKGKAQDLRDTLDYLYCTTSEDNATIKVGLDAEAATLVSRGLAEKIVGRVENLLPEDCGSCKKEYCYHPLDVPELRCLKCSKGACPTCYEEDKVAINNLKMRQGGLYYICQTCTVDVKKLDAISIEGRTAQWKKKYLEEKEKEKSGEIVEEVVEEEEEEKEEEQGDADDSCIFTSGTKDNNEDAFKQVISKKKEKKEAQKKKKEESEEEAKKKKGICRHFIRNRCREGIRGENCSFYHPRKCSKGVKEGAKGCKDKKCSLYHAKVCYGSLQKPRLCAKAHCTFVHLPNTERRKGAEKEHTKEQRSAHPLRKEDFPKLPEKPAIPRIQQQPLAPSPVVAPILPVTPQVPQVSDRLDEVEKMLNKMMGMMMGMQHPIPPMQQAWRPMGL